MSQKGFSVKLINNKCESEGLSFPADYILNVTARGTHSHWLHYEYNSKRFSIKAGYIMNITVMVLS